MMNCQPPTTLLIHGPASDHWTSIIRERCSNVVIVKSRSPTTESSLENVSGLIGWRFPPELLLNMPQLRWIQFISVDVVEWANNALISPDVVVTNTKGLYNDSVADYVFWSLLTLTRKFDVVIKNQSKRRWRQISGPSLKDKTLGILGLGSIGQAVAQRARAFEMKTIGVTRESASLVQTEVVDRTVTASSLPQIIGEIDALVICVPLTNGTRGLVNAILISKMRTTSYLINVSRAEITDELAIRQALRKNRLAGAALDVFEREPLRRWNSIWKEKNLIVTPHLAGLSSSYQQRVGDLICENVNRFSRGKELLNIVDPLKGY